MAMIFLITVAAHDILPLQADVYADGETGYFPGVTTSTAPIVFCRASLSGYFLATSGTS